MSDFHSMTPPLDLLKYWEEQHFDEGENYDVMLIKAYQAGADHELDACCEWIYKLMDRGLEWSMDLRAARRPEPPSLKEQALDELHISFDRGYLKEGAADTIRRAIEALPDDHAESKTLITMANHFEGQDEQTVLDKAHVLHDAISASSWQTAKLIASLELRVAELEKWVKALTAENKRLRIGLDASS